MSEKNPEKQNEPPKLIVLERHPDAFYGEESELLEQLVEQLKEAHIFKDNLLLTGHANDGNGAEGPSSTWGYELKDLQEEAAYIAEGPTFYAEYEAHRTGGAAVLSVYDLDQLEYDNMLEFNGAGPYRMKDASLDIGLAEIARFDISLWQGGEHSKSRW